MTETCHEERQVIVNFGIIQLYFSMWHFIKKDTNKFLNFVYKIFWGWEQTAGATVFWS